MSKLFPLNLQDATTRRRGKVLVGPVTLDWNGSGTLVLMGPNGAGKTSLLRLMHGTARLHAGRVDWACPLEDARHHQSFVFQRPTMLRRSVQDNIAYPLQVRGMARTAARAQAAQWADRIGLTTNLTRPAHFLSGGEQQKLALARALITNPMVLFLDEPTAALDGQSKREIENILRQEKSKGLGIVMATHDLGQARRLADEVIFLIKGQVAERAPAPDFFEGPQTSQAQAFLKGDIVE